MANPFGKGTPVLTRFRQWWYNNVPGDFEVEGHKITKRQAQVSGGPNPEFNGCVKCQIQEWLSRVTHRNFYQKHGCKLGAKCMAYCENHTSDQWANYHQNFWFALGCDPSLKAPRGLVLFPDPSKPRLWKRYFTHCCDQWAIVLRRQFAQAAQIDVVKSLDGVNWKNYDFMFFQNCYGMPTFKKPPIPLIMYGHDAWKGDLQTPLTALRPEILLTPYPSLWKRQFNIPKGTESKFYLLSASQFLSRPNLGAKALDIMTVGTFGAALYAPRRELERQVRKLANEGYKVGSSHVAGYVRNDTEGPVTQSVPGKYTVHWLNAWSAFLGQAKFVTFGPCAPPAHDMVLMKYCEVLGSGAIPILPEVPDLEFLKIKPLVHYLPLSMVWQDNAKLMQLIDNYEDYRYIAANAVKWHEEVADVMLFDGFENLIREVTGKKYPKRLVA